MSYSFISRANVLETLLTAQTRLVLQLLYIQKTEEKKARRQTDTKIFYGGVFLLLPQRSKHPREMVITPKASTSNFSPLSLRHVATPSVPPLVTMLGRKLCRRSLARRTPRPCSVCCARRPCKRRERRLTGRALAVGVRKDLGGLRCLTLRYSLSLSVWVDPNAEHRLKLAACVAFEDFIRSREY